MLDIKEANCKRDPFGTELLDNTSCYKLDPTSTEKDKVLKEIYKWVNEGPEIGNVKNYFHSISLRNNIFCKPSPYKIPYKIKDKLMEEIERLEELRIIRKSHSDITSPAFPIPKRNGSLRLVVDYRRLNSATAKSNYPFPSCEDQMLSFQGKKVFSCIDLNQGYYQVNINESDIPKTSFILPYRQWEFLKMPFGLCNAPRTFARIMNEVLGHLPFVRIFLDDIIIASSDEAEHCEHLRAVIEILKNNGFTINHPKSEFFKDKVKYLGIEVSSQGRVPVSNQKFELLGDKKIKTKKQVMKVVGNNSLVQKIHPEIKRAYEADYRLIERKR